MPRHENLITNGEINGETGWTLGTGYSVDTNSILWSSVSDTTAEASQTVILAPHTFYKLTLDFLASLTDPTIVTSGESSSSLENAQITLIDTITSSSLGTVYIGQSDSYVKRGCIIYSDKTTSLKVAVLGRRAGTARFKNFSLNRLNLPRSGQLVAPQMNFPSFKGGNYREMESADGTDTPVTWLTTAQFTSENRTPRTTDFNNVYLRNNIKVVRLFINVFGDYNLNFHMVNSDWSALNSTESDNLQSFFNSDIPNELKVRVVFTRHTGIPNSVINTSLTPVNAHETREKFMARLEDAANLLLPYVDKIHSWEVVNEPNLNIGEDVSWGNLQSFLSEGYTVLKSVSSLPVAVSHQSQVVYQYPLITADTSDFYDMHWYANQPWKTTVSNAPISCLPECMDKPIIMGEWGHLNYTVSKDNLSILEPSFNLFFRLGFEHVAPWSVKDAGDPGNQPVETRTYVTPSGMK